MPRVRGAPTDIQLTAGGTKCKRTASTELVVHTARTKRCAITHSCESPCGAITDLRIAHAHTSVSGGRTDTTDTPTCASHHDTAPCVNGTVNMHGQRSVMTVT